MPRQKTKISSSELTNVAIAGLVLLIFLIGMGYYAIYWKPNHEVNVDKNLALWEQSKPDSYSYEISVFCFCPEKFPYTILVSGDVEVAVPSEGREPEYYEGLRLPDEPITIGALFQKIQMYSRTAASIKIEYDNVLGYPKLIRVDHNFATHDDEVSYVVSNFKVFSEN
jgi:hypothetical protein